MSDDKFKIIHEDEEFEITVRVVRRTKEYVGKSTYRNEPEEASKPTIRQDEVESIQFLAHDKQTGINRAIQHLSIIGEFQ